WLYNQIDNVKFNKLSVELLNEEIIELVDKIRIEEKFNDSLFLSLKKLLKPYFFEQRIITPYRVALLKYIHFFDKAKIKIKKKLNLPFRRSRRRLPNRGII